MRTLGQGLVIASLAVGCGGAIDAPPETPAERRTDLGWAKGAIGCGNFEVVVTHASRRKLLVIEAQKDRLGLAKVGDSVVVPLTTPPDPRASLRVDAYDAPGGDAHYCTDVRSQTPKKVGSASATRGTVRFTLSKIGENGTYSIDVALEGVAVKAADGTTEAVPDASYTEVGVGWLPG